MDFAAPQVEIDAFQRDHAGEPFGDGSRLEKWLGQRAGRNQCGRRIPNSVHCAQGQPVSTVGFYWAFTEYSPLKSAGARTKLMLNLLMLSLVITSGMGKRNFSTGLCSRACTA